jgi:hypothetical protein
MSGYLDKYDKYIEFLKSDKYKKYIEGLHIFFNNNPKQLCPICNVPNIQKDFKDGKIIMECKTTKCSWSMEINPAKYINLYNEFYDKSIDKEKLLFNLLKTDEFENVKKDYLNEKNSLEQIKDVFSTQKDELDKKINEETLILTEILVLYYKRKQVFDDIEKSLKPSQRKGLMKIYKNEYKTLNEKRVQQIAKEYSMSVNDVKNSIQWFHYGFEYIKLQQEYKNIRKETEEYKNNIKKLNENFMIDLPNVIENKKLKGGDLDETDNIVIETDEENNEENNELTENIKDDNINNDNDINNEENNSMVKQIEEEPVVNSLLIEGLVNTRKIKDQNVDSNSNLQEDTVVRGIIVESSEEEEMNNIGDDRGHIDSGDDDSDDEDEDEEDSDDDDNIDSVDEDNMIVESSVKTISIPRKYVEPPGTVEGEMNSGMKKLKNKNS